MHRSFAKRTGKSDKGRVTSDKRVFEMKVRARLYAQLRDIADAAETNVDLADGARVSDLLEKLYARFPRLRAQDKTILLGVGVEFVDRNYQLKGGEEISVMPPVQGG